MRTLLFILFVAAFASCVRSDNTLNTGIQAYVPIYASIEELAPIAVAEPMPTSKPGKIYVYQNYIFQNELYKGIHVIDNSDPFHPVKKAFINIPFNTDMAIRNNHIYANAVNDLVVINMSDPLHPHVVSTTKDAFPMIVQTHPPFSGYFVCPDPEKGVVIDRELKQVDKALCRG